MLERVLAAIFERIRRLPLILSLSLSLPAHINIYMYACGKCGRAGRPAALNHI
jgi:hypothetical protein